MTKRAGGQQNGPDKKASKKMVDTMKAKASEKLREADKQEEKLEAEEKVEADLASIICELIAKPEKLKRAKKAILSDQFLDPVENPLLHDTIIKMDRVPGTWLERYLKHRVPALTDEKLKSMRKADGQSSTKHFFKATRSSPSQRVPARSYPEFEAYYDKRVKDMDLQASLELILTINAKDYACFRLWKASDDLECFTHVVLQDDAGADIARGELPKHYRITTDDWKLDKNWDMLGAKLLPKESKSKKKDVIILAEYFDERDISTACPEVPDWRYPDEVVGHLRLSPAVAQQSSL